MKYIKGVININYRRVYKIICVFIVFGIILVLIPNVIVRIYVKNNITYISDSPNADVAIILGAYVMPNGRLCDMLKDRVDTGIELYNEGKVKKLLMSGDHGQTTYDEVNRMREYAQGKGIPPEDIFMDHAGFSTYESMYRAKEIFKVESSLIVTQKFHLPRSIYIAKRFGIKANGVIADKYDYAGQEYNILREVLAITKDFYKTNIFRVKPTFLGDSIPIDGDGTITQDSN